MNSDISSDMQKRDFVVVIGREYGSGGRRIGKQLAKELGVPYYDKSLLQQAAARLGYSPKIFENKDERRPSIIRSLLSFTYGSTVAGANDSSLSDEKIYEFQSRVIQDLCAKGSCVIVGRTADYIMRQHPGLISVFIHAPLEHKVKHIIERGEKQAVEDAKSLSLKIDREREAYYNYFTNRHWGRCSNYHLSFDSSITPDDTIIATIKSIITSRN